MKTLYIIRGLPGSGKTTLAKRLAQQSFDNSVEGAVRMEADDFFTDDEGNYHFAPSKLGEAHAECQKGCDEAMKTGVDVIISNTFSMQWEAEPYYNMAEMHAYTVFIVECQNAFSNTHAVPAEAIKAMMARWEDLA